AVPDVHGGALTRRPGQPEGGGQPLRWVHRHDDGPPAGPGQGHGDGRGHGGLPDPARAAHHHDAASFQSQGHGISSRDSASTSARPKELVNRNGSSLTGPAPDSAETNPRWARTRSSWPRAARPKDATASSSTSSPASAK